ncbi:ABC transporter substrate-binding protein [Desulforhopalus sp. 52FAK]
MTYLRVIDKNSRFITVCLILLLFVCCSSFLSLSAVASGINTTENVTLHLRWKHQFQFAGYYAAIEKGFYEDEGLDVELQTIQRGTGMINPVIDGTADYGVADGSLLAARAQGASVVLLAQIFQHSPQIFLSLRETGIYTPYDIGGKKVMFDASSASLNMLFLETLGGSENFEIVPQSYNINDLIDGKVQLVSAYLTNEPYQLRKRGLEFNVLHPRGYGIDYVGDNLFTSETELRNNPQRAQKMIRATIKGWQYALKNKNEIIDLIINNYDPKADRDKLVYESQVTEQMILPDLIPMGEIDVLRFKEIAKGYARLGVIDSAEIPEGLFYREQQTSKLDLTFKEQAWLIAHPQVTLGTGQDWSPYIIVAPDGSLSGIEADLIQRINEIAGTNIRIIVGERLQVIEKAKAREIDGLLVSSAQKKTAPYFLFTNSPYSTYKYIFTTTLKITSMDDLKGKRVAYQRSIGIHKNFLKNYPEVTPVPADNADALVLLLQNKKVDAVIGGNIFRYYLQDRMFTDVHPEYIVPGSKVDVVYSIRKDWPELHSIINKALAKISPAEINGIIDKWLFTRDVEKTIKVPLSETERAWLKAHSDIQFGFTDTFPPYLIKTSDGRNTGVMVDVLSKLNENLGSHFSIDVDSWSEVLKKNKDNQLAGVLVVSSETAEANGLLKSETIFSVYPSFFAREDASFTFTTLDALKGKSVGILQSSEPMEKILEPYRDDISLKKYATNLGVLEALYNREVDLAFGLTSNNYLIAKYNLSGIRPVYTLFNRPSEIGFGVNPALPELVPIINKGLNSFLPNQLEGIKAKWFNTPAIKVRKVVLSAAENAWLSQKHSVRVRAPNYPPYVILKDDTDPEGITIDYLNLIAERTGVTFDFVHSGKTFPQALDSLKKHQGVDLMPIVVRTPERAKSILFSKDYLRTPYMIFMRADEKKIVSSLEDISDREIALIQGAAQYETMKKEYPNIKLKLFDTDIKALEAVSNKQADAYIGNMTMASYIVLNKGLLNLKIVAPSPFGDQVAAMGIRNDWPELNSIVDKGLASITPDEQRAIYNKYITVHYDKATTAEYVKWILIVAGIASGLLLLFFFWNRILAKQVVARTTELKESETKYRNVLESTSTVPWELDLSSGVFTFMGIQIEKILGYPADSWKDMAVWAERVHHEDRDAAILFCETETEKGQDHDFVYRSLHADGSYRWIRDVVSVIEGENGPETLVGFMHDITEQKELALEKEQLQKQWEQSQKLEAIGTLAGGIAHDFNNILSIIVGFSGLAKENSSKGSEIYEDLSEVLKAAQRAKELVQQILAFSRQSQINSVPLEPGLIVKEALKMLRSSIPTTIQIHENIDKDCGTVVVDPTQIHQIMLNLCTNAFHAMEDEGGTMTVALKRADIVPSELPESVLGYIELLVSDTGKGINKETIPKIFDPFFTTKEQGKGTGMGLSIIYGIAKEHGGGVTVESEMGKGTTFHVYFPRFEDTPTPAPISGSDILGGTERILFVDDEENITKIVKGMLEKAGYTVTVKMDSFEALKIFQNQPDEFDLVITDQTMPGMTGLDLSKRMLQKRPEIPIILCTGYSSIVNEEIAKAQGIKEYISKPFTRDTLHSLIRKVLDTP